MIRHSSGRWTVALTLSLCFWALPARAQDAKAAKDAYEKGKAAHSQGDDCTAEALICQAARSVPNNKDYGTDCAALTSSDKANVTRAQGYLDNRNYDSARRYAKFVCKSNKVQYDAAQQILQDIQQASAPVVRPPAPAQNVPSKDETAIFYGQASNDFGAGNFAAAYSEASKVTDPALKSYAGEILRNIDNYNSDIAQAQQKEGRGDYQGAIQSYNEALNISRKGPNNPAGHIVQLQAKLVLEMPPIQPQQPTPSTPAPAVTQNKPGPGNQPGQKSQQPEDPKETINRLLTAAKRDQDVKNYQHALKNYGDILRLDPGNSDATAGRTAMEALLNADPIQRENTLAQAIREFYSSNFDDARDDLDSYLGSADAKSKGAAYFYRGATIIYKRTLQKSDDKANTAAQVQENFRLARAANYQPLEKYVSPVVRKVWEGVR